jgi:hypothetical protein
MDLVLSTEDGGSYQRPKGDVCRELIVCLEADGLETGASNDGKQVIVGVIR